MQNALGSGKSVCYACYYSMRPIWSNSSTKTGPVDVDVDVDVVVYFSIWKIFSGIFLWATFRVTRTQKMHLV